MTTLLAGSDFHLGPLCERFGARLGEDVLPIFAGDLVNRPRDDAPLFHAFVERWQQANPDLVIVPGNHDPDGPGPWDGVRVHERRGLRILAIPVIPILYKIPMWTHEHSETRIAELVAPFRGEAFDLVVSHGPPQGVCDRASWGRNIGSHALLEFAATIRFRLWICGHVHEQAGMHGTLQGRPAVNVARSVLDVAVPAGEPRAAAHASRVNGLGSNG